MMCWYGHVVLCPVEKMNLSTLEQWAHNSLKLLKALGQQRFLIMLSSIEINTMCHNLWVQLLLMLREAKVDAKIEKMCLC